MKKVLVIGYVWPEPNSSAAGRHMLSLLGFFKSQHWQVEFATPAQPTEHMIDLANEGITARAIALNCSSFDDYVSKYQPDLVMFDRFMMEEQFGWRVEKCCPQAIRVLDTEDLQCLRQARHQALKAGRALNPADLCSDIAKREIAAIFRSDLSLIISSYEMALLIQHFKVDDFLLMHLPFMVEPEEIRRKSLKFEERQHFLTIGNFRHAPNWDAVLYLQQLWPHIRKQLPQAELHVYGSYPPPKATALHNPQKGFHIKGWAEDTLKVMEQARVCLAPLRFGAGIKGKLLDAMLVQTPSVTTSVGAEGMHSEPPWPGLIEDEPNLIVEAAVRLYQEKSLWDKAQQQATALLDAQYDGKQHRERLRTRLAKLETNLAQHRQANFTGAMLRHHSMASTQYMFQWIEVKNRSN